LEVRRLKYSHLLSSLLVLILSACASSEVKERFGKEQSCPENQIAVTRLRELPAGLVPPPPPAPPPEVASDPARLAVFRSNNPGESYEGRRVFVAEGCGHKATYMCNVPTTFVDSAGRSHEGRSCKELNDERPSQRCAQSGKGGISPWGTDFCLGCCQ